MGSDAIPFPLISEYIYSARIRDLIPLVSNGVLGVDQSFPRVFN